jgi:ATPase subunit of ABC transporter with duplicated ATPase domains
MLESNRFQLFVANIATTIKSRIMAFSSRYEGETEQLKQQVTDKSTELDRNLAQRYPDRYSALKQQAEEAQTWYEQQIAEQKANPDRPLLVDQNNRRLSERIEELGQNVAQTEREVRSKIAAKLRSKTPKF